VPESMGAGQLQPIPVEGCTDHVNAEASEAVQLASLESLEQPTPTQQQLASSDEGSQAMARNMLDEGMPLMGSSSGNGSAVQPSWDAGQWDPAAQAVVQPAREHQPTPLAAVADATRNALSLVVGAEAAHTDLGPHTPSSRPRPTSQPACTAVRSVGALQEDCRHTAAGVGGSRPPQTGRDIFLAQNLRPMVSARPRTPVKLSLAMERMVRGEASRSRRRHSPQHAASYVQTLQDKQLVVASMEVQQLCSASEHPCAGQVLVREHGPPPSHAPQPPTELRGDADPASICETPVTHSRPPSPFRGSSAAQSNSASLSFEVTPDQSFSIGRAIGSTPSTRSSIGWLEAAWSHAEQSPADPQRSSVDIPEPEAATATDCGRAATPCVEAAASRASARTPERAPQRSQSAPTRIGRMPARLSPAMERIARGEAGSEPRGLVPQMHEPPAIRVRPVAEAARLQDVLARLQRSCRPSSLPPTLVGGAWRSR